MDATVTRKIGKYEITGILGRGGMGVVYRAEDKRIGRLVAIKTLTEGFSGQPEMLERFYREAQAGILQHPNIVIVYDLGDEDGMPFIVMEYVDGEPLDQLIASGRQLPLIDRLSIIEQVCSALGYAHQRGVVHRDIKPANVIVQPDGHAKIVDFGIARVQSAGSDTGLTRTGSVIGTIHYIAPERLRGEPFDGRSDIFSTGVMLYLLLTGQLPFSGEEMTVLQKLINEPHPPLRDCIANYPPALDSIVDRALAKNPDHRYSTAEEFAFDLRAVIDDLKKGRVSELFNDAERLTTEQQFGRAREVLLQIVKIDSQHTGAKQLLGIVQQHLARQQRAEQIRQLVAEAEQFLHVLRFPEAQASFEQAIKLDPENAELQERLEAAKEKRRRFDQINDLMSQADALRQKDDWTGALRIVERALQVDPENPGIRAAHAEVARQAKAAAQQGQIRDLLSNARQEMSARRFTAAIEILREVGKLDASTPDLEGLLQTAITGQEQERRRKLLDQIQAEIENCLQANNYERATDLVNRAVDQLPTEVSLLQLKARVAAQYRAFGVRQLVDATVSRAQEVFLQSPGEALLIVQKALQEVSGEERLLRLEDSLKQRLKTAEKEEVLGRYLREAQEAIDCRQFDKAVEILESYQLEFGDAAGVNQLLEFARAELSQQQRHERIAACSAQARSLLQQERYDEVVRLLEPAASETEDPALTRLLAEARAQQAEASRKAEALVSRVNRLRERGQFDEAVELLQSVPAASVAGTQLNSLLTEIRSENARRQALAKATAAAIQALEERDFHGGLEPLHAVQRAYGESAELSRAIADFESRRTQIANEELSKSVETARGALLNNDAAAALREFERTAPLVEFAGAAQQADWRRLYAEAARPAARRTTSTVPVFGSETSSEEQPRRSLLPMLIAGGLAIVLAAGGLVWWVRHQAANSTNTAQNVPSAPVPAAPAPATAPTGTLLIKGNVDGVGVFVDGPIKGFTLNDGTLRLPLDPGTHSIRFAKAGYADYPPATVTITANQEQNLSFTLAKSASAAPPPETEAYLMVHSTPGASVSVDNATQGKADARGNLIVQVKPGKRSLQISLDGYEPVTQSFNLKVGEKTDVAALLAPVPTPAKPVPAATPAPQPAEIVSFSAADSQIVQGQSTTLRWQTANATDVSIDNGIARVDSSGETTVRPSSTTTYMLTAKGNGTTQQRSVNVVVEPKVESAPAPVVKAPQPADDSTLLLAAINNFGAAWNAHDMGRMQAVWTGLKPAQVHALQSFFKENPGARVSDDCSSSGLSISGDTASWSCTESTTIVANGKPLVHTQGIRFTFARRNGNWTMEDRR